MTFSYLHQLTGDKIYGSYHVIQPNKTIVIKEYILQIDMKNKIVTNKVS